MINTERILVIFLSGFLALFLLLGTLLTIKIIQLVNSIKRVVEKAEDVVDKAEAVGDFFERTTARFAVGRLLTSVAGIVKKRSKSK